MPVPVGDPPGSMAVHVLVACGLRNLRNRVWRRDDVLLWLDGMDESTREAVRVGMNDGLGLG